MKLSLLSILATLVVSASAQAAWYLTPALGYEMGSSSVKQTGATTTTDSSLTGIMGELQFGHLFGNRMTLGVDYSMLTGGKSTPSDTTIKPSTLTASAAYVTFGYAPGRWSMYVGYAPSFAAVLTSETAGSTAYTYTGSSTKVGFSFDIKNHFGIGFEYIMPTFSTVDPKVSSQSDVSKAYSTFTQSSYNINFRFPFMF